MDRTIVLQLNPTPEQATLLQETLAQYTACFNAVALHGFETSCSNGVQLHKETYYPLRAEFPHLPAQLVCAARVKATEAVKSALTWKGKQEKAYPKKGAKAQKKGYSIPPLKPVKAPESEQCPIRYDMRSYWVKWATNTCSLATVDGRVELPFAVSAHLMQYVGYKTCSADLLSRKGHFTLHVVVSIPQPDISPTNDVIGVDLGLNRPAVTSTHDFLGEQRWKEQERRLFRLKRKLAAKGTRSAKRHLKKLSGKLFRQRRDHDHVLSKRIVQSTPQGATLVLENLTNIRESSKIGRGKEEKTVDLKRRFHRWSFAQFHAFLDYKAEARGIRVEKVDPRHTSQTCSRCGFHHRSNRRSQSLFHCRSCGYQLNADLNASYNIRDKYLSTLASPGRPSRGGPQSIGLSCPLADHWSSEGETQAPAF
jgi:IS605 OrfB family transposase